MKFTVVYKKISERYVGFVKELADAPRSKIFSPHFPTIFNPENSLIQ